MRSYVVEPSRIHKWQTKSGYRILVMDHGAVRFDFPKDWFASAHSQYVQLIDREPPDSKCILVVSCRQISLPMMTVPMHDLLREVTLADTDSRQITCRGPIFRVFRPPLEAAWLQMHFDDPIQGTEGCTRVCLARGGRTLATILFDFFLDDELRLHSAWTTLLETLAVGDYIEDPTTGRKREQRG